MKQKTKFEEKKIRKEDEMHRMCYFCVYGIDLSYVIFVSVIAISRLL